MREDNNQTMIPYVAYESALARNERTIKRLIISLVSCILLVVICNCAWLYAWCQFEYVDEETTTTTVQQDGEGQNVYGDNNNVNEPNNNNSKKETQTDAKKER